MILFRKAILWPCLAAILLAVATLAAPASAQDANIRSVTFYTVKPDRIGDFQAEIKEYNAILAKAGSDRYSTIWVALTGPYEFARVQMYSKWADLDNTIDKDPKLKDQAVDLARPRHAHHRVHLKLAARNRGRGPRAQPARHRRR
jgi:hypothetical protein